MSLRQKFEGVGCKRFGDDKEGMPSVDKKMRRDGTTTEEEMQTAGIGEISKLRAENKALKQQVASQALEIAELRGTKTPALKRDDENSAGRDDKKSASSGRGRPRLPEDVRKANRAKQIAAANKKRRQPKS